MKKMLAFVAVAASLLLASGAQAQGLRIKAHVPFDFAIGKATYPAGTYDFQQVWLDNSVMSVTSPAKARVAMTHDCVELQAAEKTVLLFHRVGGEYFLYRIWTAGNNRGIEFTQPKREIQLAQNGGQPEAIVAVDLIQ